MTASFSIPTSGRACVEGAGISARVVKPIDAARASGSLFIAAMTVWEVSMLAAKGQIGLNGPTLEWVNRAILTSSVVVHPLEPAFRVPRGG